MIENQEEEKVEESLVIPRTVRSGRVFSTSSLGCLDANEVAAIAMLTEIFVEVAGLVRLPSSAVSIESCPLTHGFAHDGQHEAASDSDGFVLCTPVYKLHDPWVGGGWPESAVLNNKGVGSWLGGLPVLDDGVNHISCGREAADFLEGVHGDGE